MDNSILPLLPITFLPTLDSHLPKHKRYIGTGHVKHEPNRTSYPPTVHPDAPVAPLSPPTLGFTPSDLQHSSDSIQSSLSTSSTSEHFESATSSPPTLSTSISEPNLASVLNYPVSPSFPLSLSSSWLVYSHHFSVSTLKQPPNAAHPLVEVIVKIFALLYFSHT